MANNKQGAIAIISEYLMGVDPSGFNLKFYQDNHFKLPEKEFHKWMEKLESGKEHIIVYGPSESSVTLDFKRNLAFAKKKGVEIYERLWYEASGSIPNHLTPVKYMVLPTIVRRQAQLLTKKISVPSNMKRLNPLTGQPTGESKSAKMSLPETQLMAASGLEHSLKEVLGPRGGDSGSNAALTGMLVKTGKASLRALSAFSSGVDATKYMKAIFTAAHIHIGPL